MKKIISDYMKNHKKGENAERDFFKSCKTLEEAVSYAALARDNESKFSHQYRISNDALEDSRIILLKEIEKISKVRTFHELFELINSLIRPIHGIGDLVIYDTALRIGIKLGIKPEYIYLHAGTKEGAKNLGLPINTPFLHKSQIPKEFRDLEADQIESIFCIYKNDFNNRSPTKIRGSHC